MPSASLDKLADRGLAAWEGMGVKGQREPILHQMRQEVQKHNDIEAAASAIYDTFGKSVY